MMWRNLRLAWRAPGGQTGRSAPADYRCYYGYLALIPAALALGLGVRHSGLPESYPALTLLLLAIAGILTYAGSLLWARRVPSVVSLGLGLVLWAATFWRAWHGQM